MPLRGGSHGEESRRRTRTVRSGPTVVRALAAGRGAAGSEELDRRRWRCRGPDRPTDTRNMRTRGDGRLIGRQDGEGSRIWYGNRGERRLCGCFGLLDRSAGAPVVGRGRRPLAFGRGATAARRGSPCRLMRLGCPPDLLAIETVGLRHAARTVDRARRRDADAPRGIEDRQDREENGDRDARHLDREAPRIALGLPGHRRRPRKRYSQYRPAEARERRESEERIDPG